MSFSLRKPIAAALLLAASTFSIQPAVALPAQAPVGDLPQASAADMAAFRSQVDALYRMKERAFANKDAATIVEQFYSNDAVSFGPDGKPSVGRDAFRAEYNEVVKLGVPTIEPVYTHVGRDAAWEWVNFHVRLNDRTQKDFTFIMLFVFAKVDGKWVSGGDAYTIGAFPTPK